MELSGLSCHHKIIFLYWTLVELVLACPDLPMVACSMKCARVVLNSIGAALQSLQLEGSTAYVGVQGTIFHVAWQNHSGLISEVCA
jgi:hypothetical protein